MILLVGLGNPGGKYANNRHNIGFMAVDEIVRRHSSFTPWRSKFSGQMCEGTIQGVKVQVLKPETYMNESGRSVSAAARFFKVSPENVIVFHDELDLPPSKLKVKVGGGHGGHNGLRSIDAHLGKDYRRVRLGIGHPGDKERVHSHVLGDFSKAEQPELEKFLDSAALHLDFLLKGEDAGYMNKVALDLRPQRPNKVKTKEASSTQSEAKAQDGPAKPDNDSPFSALKNLFKSE